MPRIPVGKCSNCDAAVSYFARFCPRCHAANWPNPVFAAAMLLAVLLVGGAIGLGALFLAWSKKAPQDAKQQDAKQQDASSSNPSRRARPPATMAGSSPPWPNAMRSPSARWTSCVS